MLPALLLRDVYLAIAALSFGEIIRVVFSNTQSVTNDAQGVIRALMSRPKLLMMDEAALEVADHAYVLEVGSVVLEGGGAELLKDSRVQAAYLGE